MKPSSIEVRNNVNGEVVLDIIAEGASNYFQIGPADARNLAELLKTAASGAECIETLLNQQRAATFVVGPCGCGGSGGK